MNPRKTLLPILIASVVAACSSGCKAIERAKDPSYTGPFRTQFNYAIAPGAETNQLRRLVVLPLTGGDPGSNEALDHGRQILQPLLLEQLRKSPRFEVVGHSGLAIPRLRGGQGQKVSEVLPHATLLQLANDSGADAALFAELTAYQAHPPLVTGFRLTLVRLTDGAILWEFNDVFNSGEPTTRNSARRFLRERGGVDSELDGPSQILNSPRRFSDYALSASLNTLPTSWLK
jgi:hypothetical protein